ncbi:uracil-DNA glycosylase family protein [Methylobacter sp. S3L5C]|uniref:uracil-DNA glycosylase family protein n=1 Tax=Methylobacter sp. S3L5C TaxID=2839024 RepID=UPI001FADDF18|nr:uracil-DNA glycosylase family protein [Methylobacter sp. S3L5C]UOA09761.1 uracil-DNA glycosylase family protein [Methylobacter sp. S3L5C]
MDSWKFTPYDINQWNKAEERILFVASEPNGDKPNSGILDMGDWFRTAAPKNKYHKNKPFFRRCEIMLNGINDKNIGNIFDNFRFMALNPIQGDPTPGSNTVSDYVTNNMNEVIKYFNSTDKKFGLAPNIIVLLGNTAQSVFIGCIRKQLINDKSLKWIAMPHPSAQIAYDGLEMASKKIREHLKPINEDAEKWVYQLDNFDDWRSI